MVRTPLFTLALFSVAAYAAHAPAPVTINDRLVFRDGKSAALKTAPDLVDPAELDK